VRAARGANARRQRLARRNLARAGRREADLEGALRGGDRVDERRVGRALHRRAVVVLELRVEDAVRVHRRDDRPAPEHDVRCRGVVELEREGEVFAALGEPAGARELPAVGEDLRNGGMRHRGEERHHCKKCCLLHCLILSVAVDCCRLLSIAIDCYSISPTSAIRFRKNTPIDLIGPLERRPPTVHVA